MKRNKKKKAAFRGPLPVIVMVLMIVIFVSGVSAQDNYIHFRNAQKLQDHFRYKGDGSILVSGHRGGREPGFPENSIEGFQNVLNKMSAFFEIDPQLTKTV
jgi:glycerophosphoryl diester phosphodiesterase